MEDASNLPSVGTRAPQARSSSPNSSYEEEPEDCHQQTPMHVDSDEIPSPSFSPSFGTVVEEPFYQQLMHRMFSPATACMMIPDATHAAWHACSDTAYHSCLASDREELEWQLTELLRKIRRANHTVRSPALYKLYRLTDRDREANRYGPAS